MAKARDAFRTISEVSDWLDTPAHVLRFWESKFSQVKPVKRAGGRRYYRPDDMALLGGIKVLLHEQGMTIKGAQKLLRENGVKHVAAMSPDLFGQEATDDTAPDVAKVDEPAPETKSAMAAPEPAAEIAPAEENTPPAPEPAIADPVPASPPEADNVTPITAMPPLTQRPPKVATAAAVPTPEQPPAPKAEPAPRILAALRDADDNHLRARAAEIAPLVARLQDVRDRMRKS